MASFSKSTLSGSTDGRGIKVAATSSAGTTIHTGPSSTSHFDEITLYAYNSSSSPVVLTLQWGGTSSPDDDIKFTVPSQDGLYLLTPNGLTIKGNATPLVVRAYAGTTNVITIHGYYQRRA